MKRTYIFLFLLALCATIAQAQEQRRTWSAGPLTWSDFTLVHPTLSENPDEHSFLEFVFDITTVAHDHNGITSGEAEAVAYTVRSKSWVDSSHRTPAELRYNQVLFDMVELYRRELQQMINTAIDLNEEQLLDSIMQIAIDGTDQYCAKTRYGNDSLAVQEWGVRIASALRNTDSAAASDKAAIQSQHAYTDEPLRLGASLLLGFMGTGGEMHDYFSHGFGMGMDFEIGYNRHFFLLGFNIGGASCLKNAYNVRSAIDSLCQGDALTILNGYFGYGYSVVDRAKIRVTPFVGWGGLGYYYTEDGDSEYDAQSYGSANGCWHFGVNTQYHINNTIFAGYHERYSIDLKLFGTYNRFRAIQGTPEGFTFNIQLGISMLSGTASRNKQQQ